jgi:hypothetical protein
MNLQIDPVRPVEEEQYQQAVALLYAEQALRVFLQDLDLGPAALHLGHSAYWTQLHG